MDTSDPEIRFDDQGICDRCTAGRSTGCGDSSFRLRNGTRTRGAGGEDQGGRREDGLRLHYRSQRRDRQHDTAYGVKKLGLRALAVHFDNGWDSELAVDNIRNTLQALNIDLFTYVVDWEEFVNLQLSFLRANVVNCESPTDHGITATLFRMANKENVRFILSGSNLVTEAIMPISWAYYNQDLRNLKAIHRRFGKKDLKTFPTISIVDYLYYVFVEKIRQVPFLNYIEYNRGRSEAPADEGDRLARLRWKAFVGLDPVLPGLLSSKEIRFR